MPVAALHLLTPLGALASLAALLPVAAAGLAARRSRRVAALLGLRAAGLRAGLPRAAAAAGVCVLLGLAAAQPVLLASDASRRIRTDSQVLFVIDVSRSMLAAASPGAPTRLERARAAVSRLRRTVADVPAGLAGLTDRVLPYAFPTAKPATFADVLRYSVAIEAPPPQEVSTISTSFDALAALSRDGFFARSATRRTCVLVTDGESRPFSSGAVARALEGGRGCSLVVVSVWASGERIYNRDGDPEAGYRPDPAAPSTVRRLRAATGGSAFGEQELGRAVVALRNLAERGPTARTAGEPSVRRFAPGLAAGALVLALALGISGLAGARLSRTRSVA
jgi:von Willebrand factor type A domain